MKARVKATGHIVDVELSHYIGDVAWYRTKCHASYSENELDFIDTQQDYWTSLEHQAAIAAMQGLCANAKFMQDHEGDFLCHEEMIAEYAKDIAHALVEKMKEEK